MDTTANLGLPYLMAAQAQKHVTHNEAIRALDAIVQIGVADRDLSAPPPTPADGDRYIVALGGSGAWSGKDQHIAAFQDGSWAFYAPQEGWLAWVSDEDVLVAWDGATWSLAGGSAASVNPAALVGVNTTADATNKLAVKSDAVLLTNDDVTPGTGDMRLVLNKSATGNTVSQLYQTNWSGRAETGLTGDNDFHIKVSADGSLWHQAVVVDSNTGNVDLGGDTPEGRLQVRGAINCAMEPNAFGFTSPYTAFVVGDTQGAATGGNGGLYAIARHDRSLEPFTGLCGWATATARTLYFGGGGWGTPDATRLLFYTGANVETNNAGAIRLDIRENGVVLPGADNAQSFGASSLRWSAIYAANGTIQTSDKRDKLAASGLDGFAGAMVDAVSPRLFRWKIGGNEVRLSATETETLEDGRIVPKMVVTPKPGNRVHAGFFAQDIKAAMDTAKIDFAAWGLDDKDDPDSRQWLRPDQLIPVLWQALKETRAEVAELRARLNPVTGLP